MKPDMNAVAWGTMFSVLACIVLGILLKWAYDAIADLKRELSYLKDTVRIHGYDLAFLGRDTIPPPPANRVIREGHAPPMPPERSRPRPNTNRPEVG